MDKQETENLTNLELSNNQKSTLTQTSVKNQEGIMAQGHDGMMAQGHTHCLRCGRRLKSFEAQQRGYGIVCYSKLTKNSSKKLF